MVDFFADIQTESSCYAGCRLAKRLSQWCGSLTSLKIAVFACGYCIPGSQCMRAAWLLLTEQTSTRMALRLRFRWPLHPQRCAMAAVLGILLSPS